jgi:multidrug resistance efflux pump
MQSAQLKLGAAILIGIGFVWLIGGENRLPTSASVLTPPRIVAAAPGRIEGSASTVVLGAAASGIIQQIFVAQGEQVVKDQLLARIECNDIAAEVPQRIAERAVAVAVLEKLENGNRSEDIAAAEADLQLGKARLLEAEATNKRTLALSQVSAASRAQAELAERDANIASAQVRIAENKLALMKAGPRREEIAEAKARVESASHLVDATKAQLAKCDIRSPIAGTVLRKFVSEGELVSIYSPRAIFSLAKLDRYRVRAEVDENDVERVQIGQAVTVIVDPPSGRRLSGTVVELGKLMGRRQILSTDAADKSDRDVMEVMVDLHDEGPPLPVGLRVAVIFENGQK